MGTEEPTPTPAANPPTGHPIGFWFFFWGEFAERCSYYGMRAILALYMVERLGFSKADGATIMSLFIAGCYLLPIVGGLIADNLLGKYWTIVGFSLPYLAGHFILGIENRYVVFGALALLAMGSGVIKPNISTLMGMTYDQQRPGQEQLRSNAFSWFYLAINIGAFLSQLGVPYVRTHYGYQMAFLFPTVLMAVALAIFAAGKRFYAVEKIEWKVLPPEEKAADRKLKLQTLGRIGALFLLVMFFWAIFDQSASTWIYFADTYMTTTLFGIPTSADAIQAFNALFIVIFLPMSVFLFNGLAKRGWKIRATDKITLGFVLTAVSMVIMSVAGFLAGQAQNAIKVTFPEGDLIAPGYDPADVEKVPTLRPGELRPVTKLRIMSDNWVYNTDNKKLAFTDGHFDLPNGQRVEFKAGHLIGQPPTDALLAGGVLDSQLKTGDALAAVKPDATKIELERVDWVKPDEKVTVWWQVFAYLILTFAEILISVTGLELAYVAAPATMKSFVTACWLFTVFLANFLINAPITRLYPEFRPGVYFAMLGGAMAVVTILFIPVALRFNRAVARDAAVGEGETEAK